MSTTPRRRILYVQYTSPAGYPPLEHSSRILASSGWEVLFLGTGAAGDANRLRFAPLRGVTVRQLPFCPSGFLQKLHYFCFSLWVLGWMFRWRAQWVYASDLLACPVALLVSFLPGVRLVYHEHDSPDGSPPSLFLRLCLETRRLLARRAEICVLPNQQRADRFSREAADGKDVLCIWNCPATEEVSPPRPAHNGGDLWVLYHGSIVPSRLPSTILTALAVLPQRVRLRVIGYETVGHVGCVRQLQEMASQLGITHRVEFVGTLPTRRELFQYCRQCDAGLALMPKNSCNVNEQTMTGASNKPFDYLACGLALLVSDLPDWRAMYVEPGYGLACDPDNPESIAAALRWFLEHPKEAREMGEKGRERIIQEWNYEKQFQPVLQQLNWKMQ